jgi:hypothetical protein
VVYSSLKKKVDSKFLSATADRYNAIMIFTWNLLVDHRKLGDILIDTSSMLESADFCKQLILGLNSTTEW